ncbi:MAG: maleylpyruvate isomerase family mycothiol-dependent enzyme [Spirillospora sp.]
MRTYTAAYEQTIRSTLALAATFTEPDWHVPTECPGWTVKDQLAHLVGVELNLLGEPDPEPGPDAEVPEFDHVRNDFGRFLETAVQLRRPLPGPVVVAQLADALERRLVQLPSLNPNRIVMCPDGREGTYTRLMKFRALDCWAHEQDIRRAVGRPGNLDAPAARCFWELLSNALPRIVARLGKAEPGRSVAFEISGPPDFHVAVRVDGDRRGHWTEPDAPTTDALTTGLAMDWESYVRLTAGRCGPDAVTVQVDGDADLAARILANMAVTP